MDEQLRVSSVELFFDLVFVFTITQLATLLAAEAGWKGLAQTGLLFGILWWMYGGYAWLTNAVPPASTARRLLLLVAMGAFLVVALAIPGAFGSSGLAFGAGYLAVVALHTGLFLQASDGGILQAMTRLGPYNALTGALVLAGGLGHGRVRWALWLAAFVLLWTSALVVDVGRFQVRAAHFVERHSTILLIALGESVVSVGIGVQGRPLTAGVVVTALLGLAVAAELWWLYFDGEDAAAERALAAAPPGRAPWLGLFAFGYAFLAVLSGIVVFAAGMKLTIVDYAGPATTPPWFLAGGVAAYVAGLAGLRAVLGSGPTAGRLALAGLALLTVVAGRSISPEWQLAVLGLVLAAGIGLEQRPTATTRS